MEGGWWLAMPAHCTVTTVSLQETVPQSTCHRKEKEPHPPCHGCVDDYLNGLLFLRFAFPWEEGVGSSELKLELDWDWISNPDKSLMELNLCQDYFSALLFSIGPFLLTQVGDCRILTCYNTNLGPGGLTLDPRTRFRDSVWLESWPDSNKNPTDAPGIVTVLPVVAEAFTVFLQSQNAFLRLHLRCGTNLAQPFKQKVPTE